jgi:hypothetical protein
MRHIPIGQLIGSTIEHLLWFALGAYVAWIRPRRLRREVLAGKISEMECQAKLKQFSPLLGYLVMVAAILWILTDFF